MRSRLHIYNKMLSLSLFSRTNLILSFLRNALLTNGTTSKIIKSKTIIECYALVIVYARQKLFFEKKNYFSGSKLGIYFGTFYSTDKKINTTDKK